MWFHSAPLTLCVPSGWVVRTPFHGELTLMRGGRSTRQWISVADCVEMVTSEQ